MALLVDGVHIGEHCIIVALGIDTTGAKHALGLWDGLTENAAVCQSLLADLVKVKVPVRAAASSKEASRTEKLKLERPETSVQTRQVPSVVNEPTPGTPPVKVASILKASAYANDAETATNATVITVMATWRWR